MAGGIIELTLATIAILGVGIYFAKHILRRPWPATSEDPYIVDVLKGGDARQFQAGGGRAGRASRDAQTDAIARHGEGL